MILHSTLMNIVVDSFPQVLFAIHLYSPFWYLLMLMIFSSFTVVTWPALTFFQKKFRGRVTLHSFVTFLPSSTFTFRSCSIVEEANFFSSLLWLRVCPFSSALFGVLFQNFNLWESLEDERGFPYLLRRSNPYLFSRPDNLNTDKWDLILEWNCWLYDVPKVHANQKEIEIFSRGNLEHSDYGEC